MADKVVPGRIDHAMTSAATTDSSSRSLAGSRAAAGPLVVSAANSRYFTVASGDGKAVYLTGSHIWNNLHDGMGPSSTCAAEAEEFDYDAYLGFLD